MKQSSFYIDIENIADMRHFTKNPTMVVILIFVLLLTFTNAMSKYLLVNVRLDQDNNQSSGKMIRNINEYVI